MQPTFFGEEKEKTVFSVEVYYFFIIQRWSIASAITEMVSLLFTPKIFTMVFWGWLRCMSSDFIKKYVASFLHLHSRLLFSNTERFSRWEWATFSKMNFHYHGDFIIFHYFGASSFISAKNPVFSLWWNFSVFWFFKFWTH